MKRFQYKIIARGLGNTSDLHELGMKGWEVVSSIKPFGGAVETLLKRDITGEAISWCCQELLEVNAFNEKACGGCGEDGKPKPC